MPAIRSITGAECRHYCGGDQFSSTGKIRSQIITFAIVCRCMFDEDCQRLNNYRRLIPALNRFSLYSCSTVWQYSLAVQAGSTV